MTNAVIETILSRTAAKYYDPAATLSDDEIRELVRIGTTAPTSKQPGLKKICPCLREARGRAQTALLEQIHCTSILLSASIASDRHQAKCFDGQCGFWCIKG